MSFFVYNNGGEVRFNKIIPSSKRVHTAQECSSNISVDTESYSAGHHLDETLVYIQEKAISGMEEFLKGKLDEWKESEIQLAVIGDSGAGKSTFINAIRG